MRRLSWCVAVAMVTAVSHGSAQGQVQSDQEVLIGLERDWNDAVYRRDADLVRNLLADEFIATYEDGSRGDKAKELQLIASFNQDVESAVQNEFAVQVHRDTAVVWFTLNLVGLKQGQRAEVRLRYTDVWVMRDGRWLCVASHATKILAQ